MSLLDEVTAEVASARLPQRSKIEIFLDTLPPPDRAEFDQWMQSPVDKSSMWRVLKRRGMQVAEPTFRAWVSRSCP